MLLIRAGNPALRDEAHYRIQLSINILELAAVQGPAIRDGIRTIKAQLDRETRTYAHIPPSIPMLQTPTSQHEQHATFPQTLTTDLFTNQPIRPGSSATQTGDQWDPLPQSFWSDSQGLMELLGAAPISTEDPFAFGTNQDWNFINPL